MPEIEKIVVVTRKTALEELKERFNTEDQAMFYLGRARALRVAAVPAPVLPSTPTSAFESVAAPAARARKAVVVRPEDMDVEEYREAHDTYQRALSIVRNAIPESVRAQFVERSFLPNFTFGENDLIITLGMDGLVVNTAKYLGAQPLLAFNPDPTTIDGVLIPFVADQAPEAIRAAVHGRLPADLVSMAKAEMNDGQSIYAVNDLFIGAKSHVSARYRIMAAREAEDQSSSGIIVSTGAGSTGWFRSVITGAAEIVTSFGGLAEARTLEDQYRFDRQAEMLYFSVREPFVSKATSAKLVFGRVSAEEPLEIISQMPQNGVIFSDGIEQDYLEFNSGATARISVAERKLRLLVA